MGIQKIQNSEFRGLIEKVKDLESEINGIVSAMEKRIGMNPEKIEARDIRSKIDNEAIENVFGYYLENGLIKDHNTNQDVITSYMDVLFNCALRHIFPVSRKNGNGSRLVVKNIRDMSQEEYDLAIDTFASIIDVLDYAKTKSSGII